jgi:hypothetical protein
MATRIIRIDLPNNAAAYIETTVAENEQDVAFEALNFNDVLTPLKGIAKLILSTFDEVKPKKASVELGIDVGVEAGHLTALIVKGTGKANLKVTLHWEQ